MKLTADYAAIRPAHPLYLPARLIPIQFGQAVPA